MKRTAVLIFLSLSTISTLFAQTSIEEEYDLLTEHWLEASDVLKTYDGLGLLCNDAKFRNNTLEILSLIHHYDSVLLDLMKDPTVELEISSHEYRKTMKELQQFEAEYGVKSFVSFLKESCLSRRDLERNKEELQKASGMYSYDGQRLVLETKLGKFLKHIDKKVVSIDKHIHHIHPDQVKEVKLLSENHPN
ncbi:hypothetical protein [Marinoscillum furvescens]|uniref:Uncharacterized protein n=1 Tax=Marinoscillum furvescens DSM 4134 TaxID=1122208 RepID=A0A3D9L4Q4_MARFU|nr:hypothetical protein [Marinoscillum furvescens]REE00072.1 hypothetical protein C7460_1069 [Marinoscillum furvescens DSM 4134]